MVMIVASLEDEAGVLYGGQSFMFIWQDLETHYYTCLVAISRDG